jgi:hypothetical protein
MPKCSCVFGEGAIMGIIVYLAALTGMVVALDSDFETGIWIFFGSVAIPLAVIGHSRLSETEDRQTGQKRTPDTFSDHSEW